MRGGEKKKERSKDKRGGMRGYEERMGSVGVRAEWVGKNGEGWVG